MSATVDSRVVEMHFDNSDFMDKIQETIAALEKLNAQIDSIHEANGLDSIVNENNGNGLDSVANSVSNIESRFSSLGVVGMTVLQRLTNAGINMGLKVGHALTAVFRQIEQGGFTRAKNIEQAEFLLSGLGADITKIMKDVNYAVEGTAYGLDEAAKASAVFFASGVKQGKEMKTALRAISGVAAMSGKSYSEMSDVFMDAAGKGMVMTEEIRRLQQQGIAADQYLVKFFNNVTNGSTKASKSVRENIEDITNGAEISIQDLTDPRKGLLSQGVIKFDTFAAAMDDAFGEHATKANETFTGSLANMKTALSRLGEMFITPAMKGAIPIFNATRKAINSFANELRDCDAVGAVWTGDISEMSDALSMFIYKVRDSGVMKEVAHSVTFAYKVLSNVLKNVAEAFDRVFNMSDSYTFLNMADSIKNFNDKLEVLIAKTVKMEQFQNVLVGIFSAFKVAKNIFSGVIKVIGAVVNAIFGLTGATGSLSEKFAGFMQKLADKSGAIGIFDLLATAINKAGQMAQKGLSVIMKGVDQLLSVFSDAIFGVNDFVGSLGLIGEAYTSLFLYTKFGRLIEGWKGDFKALFHLFDDTGSILAAPSRISKSLGSLMDTLKSMQHEVNSKILRNLAISIFMLAVSLKLISTVDAEKVATSLGAVTVLITEMMFVLERFTKLTQGDIVDSFKGLLAIGGLSNALIKVGAALVLMAIALKMIASLNPDEMARGLAALTIMLGSLLGFVVAISKFTSSAKSLGTVGIMMIELGIALNLIASAVEKMGALDPESLAKGIGSITVLFAAIFGLTAGISKFGSGGGAGMAAAGAGMVLMAAAINILVPAMQKLGNMNMPELAKGLGAVAAALTIMAAASQFLSIVGAEGFTIMAFGLASLATSIQRLGEMDVKTLAISIGALAAAMGVMLAAAAVASLVAPGLMILGAAMLVISSSVAILGAGLIMVGAGLTALSTGMLTLASTSQAVIVIFASTIATIIKTIVGIIPTIATSLAEAFVTFIETIATLAPRLREAFTTIVDEAIGAFEDNIPRLIKTGMKFIKSFLAGLALDIPKISEAAAAIIAGFINGIAAEQEALIESGINLMLSFINVLAQGIREHKDDIRNAILNLCEAILEAFCSFFGIASPSKVMKEQGANLIKGLVQGIKQHASKVATALVKAAKNGLTAIKNAAKGFVQAGVSIITNLIKGIKNKVGEIAKSITSGLSKAVTAVKNYASHFISAGWSLVQGIASGIRNGLSSVISAVGSIAQRALSHFKSVLGISSPSKEFAKLGVYIPEGAAKGIKSAANMVYLAVDKMGETSIKKMRKAVGKISDSINVDGDFNPTITPILDLSAVEKESSKINSLLAPDTLKAGYDTLNGVSISQSSALMFSMENLMRAVNKISDNPRSVTINANNYIDGSESPEAFANRFVRQLELEMRT